MTINHPDEVEALLRTHPELRPYVAEAARRLVVHFGDDATIVVDVTRAREEPEAPMLKILVETPLDGLAALERLDAFDEEWWLDQPPYVQSQLLTNFALV